MKKKITELWPDLILLGLLVYVVVLGVATVDELLGLGYITPYFK